MKSTPLRGAFPRGVALLGACAFVAACGDAGSDPAGPAETSSQPAATPRAQDAEAATPTAQERLAEALRGDQRVEPERDVYRHPGETLQFFGVEPDMTVVEIWPGGGWYTAILGPYLKSGGGKLYAASFARDGANERVAASLDRFEEAFVAKPDIFGDVEMSVLGEGGEIAPAGSADVVLTFRNVHNWLASGAAPGYFEEFYDALKPGGVLGVVEHRADGGDLARDGSSGYVYTEDVVALAEAAGFELDEASEINANPADTKDHPFGVWTLPPRLRTSDIRGEDDPDFDAAPYAAIGESDRMTLRFIKPLGADGALLE